MPDLKAGLKGERSLVVEEAHSARHLGSGGVAVYATPMLVLHMEEAALAAVDHLLPPGSATVGTALDIRHLAPTPVGMRVTAKAELISVEGRMLTFRVESFDEKERIGEGTHTRAIIDTERFAARLRAKTGAA
ncbi:MAG TPA: thioesterase family protein [Rectinemataceae bacterium]|nr:thioesterase family protein [Rectinemataceae bacterium]